MASKHTISKQLLFSLMVIMVIMASKTNAKCSFDAIFSFGDSNTDTGGYYAAFPYGGPPDAYPTQTSPYGMTYFNKPTGRAGDGRLFIDFLAQAVGVPFLSPYLQSVGSDFKHGANFASVGSTVQHPSSSVFVNSSYGFVNRISPFSLDVQINQMKFFKAKVEEFQSQGQTNLPQPDIFGKALYTINAGQNDFTTYMASAGPGGVKDIAPNVVYGIVNAVKGIYYLGGRTIMVFNLGPVGCYPEYITQFKHDSSDVDGAGCLMSYNNAVNEYNSNLKDAIGQVRQELKDANLIYVDINSVVLELFQNPSKHGLQHGTSVCCGYGGEFCGYKRAGVCADPQNYVSWDGIHLTENANKMLAYAILSDSSSNYYDPYFTLNQYCDVQPIG